MLITALLLCSSNFYILPKKPQARWPSPVSSFNVYGFARLAAHFTLWKTDSVPPCYRGKNQSHGVRLASGRVPPATEPHRGHLGPPPQRPHRPLDLALWDKDGRRRGPGPCQLLVPERSPVLCSEQPGGPPSGTAPGRAEPAAAARRPATHRLSARARPWAERSRV